MTPLSNILSERTETLSFSETLQRVEQEARETIAHTTHISQSPQTQVAQQPTIELNQIKQALLDMREQIDIMVSALDQGSASTPAPVAAQQLPPTPAITQTTQVPSFQTPQAPAPPTPVQTKTSTQWMTNGTQIIEGVFNGYKMVDASGNQYDVPANYASKSKMVEGDLLKLTITAEGRHFYKQIGPVKRKRVVGELSQDPHGNWVVISEMTPYRILTASVTFHRARQGTKAAILIPEGTHASWGAVESFLP